MSEILPRVTGTEMEWVVGLRLEGQSEFIQAASELKDILNHMPIYRRGEMMVNGARCYDDMGRLLEYATGEDDSFYGTVANEIAGEQLVAETLARYIEETPEIEASLLLKRAYHGSETIGYHVNLCGDATKFGLNAKDLYDMGLWAATCSMYTGAGCVHHNHDPDAEVQEPARLAIAQKTTHVQTGFSSQTVHEKPLICLRSEPHSNPAKYHRLQLVAIDPNIAPWASWMALGTASLCLRAIEQSRRSTMRLKEHQKVGGAGLGHSLAGLARDVAFNAELNTIATLEDHSTISALDIQWRLYEEATKTEHTDEEALALQNWEQALHSIEGDGSFLRRKAGWPIRHEGLRRYATRHGLSLDDSRLQTPDRKWDAMGAGSMAETLRGKLWKEDMPATELIADRRENPCPNTRAVLRSLAIKQSVDYETASIDWSSYRLGDERTVLLKEPLMTTVPEPDPNDSGYYEPDEEDDEMGPAYMPWY